MLIESHWQLKSALVRGAAVFGGALSRQLIWGTPVVMMTQPRAHPLTRRGPQLIAKRTMAST
jgi:hypothetical protein